MGLCYLPPYLNLLPPIAGPASHRMAIPVKACYWQDWRKTCLSVIPYLSYYSLIELSPYS